MSTDYDGVSVVIASDYRRRVVAALAERPQTPSDIADEILAGQDEFDIPAPEVSIDGVFGPLTQDVVGAFNEVLDQRLALDDLDIPNVEDVRTAVREEVEEVLEEVPGSDLLFDPDQFVDDQIDRLAGRILSEDDQQQLEDLAERVQP